MITPGSTNPLLTTADAGGYQIQRSLRFNSADSAYLNRTPASAGNRRTWTWSGWVKRSAFGTSGIFQGYFDSTTLTALGFNSTDTLFLQDYTGPSVNLLWETPAVFRDPSAWYHIVVAFDTTQASSANAVKLYVNGVQQTLTFTAFSGSYTQNREGFVNNTNAQELGKYSTGNYLNGYLADINFIDGSALTPSSFGETDTDTGVWKPKAYSGSYGTNGFYLKFADNSGTTSTTLGKDSSGNGNNWTPNNFSVTAGAGNDSLVDTPTPYGTDTGAGGEVRGNYCTMNPLQKGSTVTIANGNLDVANTTSGGAGKILGTIGVSSGKWYAEVRMSGSTGMPGIAEFTANTSTYPGGDAQSWGYNGGGDKYNGGSNAAYGASFTTNDIIGIALDMDGGSITFYKNGVSQGVAYSTGIAGKTITFAGRGDTTCTESWNFGQRAFSYTPPSGHKALCTQNLPTPTIGATATTRADDYFNTVLYTGNGSTQSITGVGFQPDFNWIKVRNDTSWHNLVDAVRGVDKNLHSNTTNAEATVSRVTSFNSDGFSLSSSNDTNYLNNTYVAWNWKANGAGSSNTQGTITSTVSANTTAGFSIVTWTANGSNSDGVGHGLGVTPKLVIYKLRNTSGPWEVWTTAIDGSNDQLYLHLTSAKQDISAGYGNLTSTTIPNWGNTNGNTMVAYCFAPVAGYSAFGSYTGNGSSDGTFVYTGFRPKFVMVKNTSATSYWQINDTARNSYNLANLALHPNVSDAEATYSNAVMDILSNGFKLRGNDTYTNTNTNVYIYMAFAEVPTKFSLAR